MLEIILWIAVTVAGFGMAVFASQKAVKQATTLAFGLGIPPFLIGVTLMSIGTDVPEIANSIMSSVTGHGDLNVGDSIGSVATQITLVLGLLPFLAGSFQIGRSRIVLIGFMTVLALGLGIFLMKDGYLSRWDGLWLLTAWVISTIISVKFTPPPSEPIMPNRLKMPNKFLHVLLLLGSLTLVGIGATAAVKGIVEIAEIAGIPEYIISFFGASIGTSLPEIVVDYTALRSGKKDIAIGDITGSCLVDATLSIGSGPLIAPTVISAAMAIKGSIVAAAAMLFVTLVFSLRGKHDRWTGALLLLFYAGAYYVFIAK
ncbi:MAG: sodium:calcium antiporter [Saprospiraceae bacterium]|nr:sodium:calcium antiporter [Saprospiraceae bacterium]MCF8250234.1 sodium:calcium antiporter [Saprospiraceae bacterium]MCF8280003.1 sodium:calcium antiporter [Bacteroidales bacterium]MCF8312042.1 sodium:calcium antiporter [Saprospiraceae bacterium]MCF8441139.1 sodium:calcium antiporter [Saprospiraceae bacterium]